MNAAAVIAAHNSKLKKPLVFFVPLWLLQNAIEAKKRYAKRRDAKNMDAAAVISADNSKLKKPLVFFVPLWLFQNTIEAKKALC